MIFLDSIRGTLRQLGEQQVKALRSHLRDTMDEAQRGGESGVEFDAAAFVRVQAGSMDGRTEVVQLGDGPRLPLWQATHDLPVSPELSNSLFPLFRPLLLLLCLALLFYALSCDL